MRQRTVALLAAGGVLAAAVAFAAWMWFLPEGSTTASENLPDEFRAAAVVATGTFRGGDAAHHTGGSVSLLRAADGSSILRFENYTQTDGPDVYVYLTEGTMPDGTADVEGAGTRLLVPGGAEGGHSTVRGDFNVPVPAGVDVTKYKAVAIWCDRFNTLFGYAPLAPP